jgi:hypothetical protein
MARIRRKPPTSQSLAQTETVNNLALALDHRVPNESLDRQHALAEIAERVRLSTGADGAAIALEEGEAVVCRARAGECAPSVGAFLNRESGLSGLCLRTGELVRCDDADTDERVDPYVAQVLQIRSVLAVPVRRDGRVIGLVEVLSRTANAFGSQAEETLQAATAEVLREMGERMADGGPIRLSLGLVAEAAPPETSIAPDGTADRLRALFAFNATMTEPADASPELQEEVDPEPAGLAYEGTETEEPSAAARMTAEVTPDPSTRVSGTGEHAREPSLARDDIGRQEVKAEEPARSGTVAEETPVESLPLMAGFEAAQAESAASPNLRALLIGAASLALLVAVGLNLWQFTRGNTPKKAPAVQAGVAGLPVEKLRSAADAGDAAAQYDLAMRYLRGDGVAPNDSDAAEWLIKSARLGNSSAQLQLGVAYELGRGVPRDLVKAYACYVMAGVNGNTGSEGAQRALIPKLTRRQIGEVRTLVGDMYQSGVGTPADNVQAYMWFSLAETAGSKEGQRARALLASKMSREQIGTAERRASEWLKRQKPAPR